MRIPEDVNGKREAGHRHQRELDLEAPRSVWGTVSLVDSQTPWDAFITPRAEYDIFRVPRNAIAMIIATPEKNRM